MAEPQTININEPRTVTLSPNTIATILDALAEMPFKRANPAIQEIFQQLTPVPLSEIVAKPNGELKDEQSGHA